MNIKITKHLSIFALATALTACSGDDNAKPAKGGAAATDERPIVEVDVAARRDVPQTKSYTANVQAFNANNISPSAPNRIKTITVDVGDHVRRGQTLVTLDDAQATQLRVNLEQIERDYNRALQLLKIGSGTQAAVDQLLSQLQAAKAQYANVLDNTVLKAPITGVVTARNYDPGDMTNGSTPVLTVGQITPAVKVVINITEADRANVSTGMPVKVTFDAFAGDTVDARITRIYPNVDAQTRTFEAEVQVPNPAERLAPGMFARVDVDHGTQSHVVVPDRAVVKQTGSGNRYVYVYKNGKVSYNRVELGRRLDNAYELLDGVADGDSLVIAGQSRLADGVDVDLKKLKR